MILNDNGLNVPFLLIQAIKILAVCINLLSNLQQRENRKYFFNYMLDGSLLMDSGKKGTLWVGWLLEILYI